MMAALVLFFVCCSILTGIAALAKQFMDEKLRRESPEIWLQQKRLEEAEKQREHERKQARYRIGGAVGSTLLRHWLN
jgi:hypothetical protein